MKKVVIDPETINIKEIPHLTPIFAKQGGKLAGMMIEANGKWILMVGGAAGATGYHDNKIDCIKSCLEYGYEFYIED